MFLRRTNRKKDGKDHRYCSVVENRRLSSGKTAQRTVLYLGEVHDKQEDAWRKTLEVFDEQQHRSRTLSLFPEDREIPQDCVDSLQVRLSGLELRRPRMFGACWLACEIWRQPGLDEFWQRRLPDGREAVSWEKVLELLVVNHFIDPASEFRVHRQWFLSTAMDELLNVDYAAAEKDRLYRCLDRVLEHKQELFVWLRGKWADLRGIPTEAVLAEMRDPARQVYYLVGTSKSKIKQHEKKWLDLPWQKVRDSVEAKLFEQDGELYVLAKSDGRQAKEMAMRRKPAGAVAAQTARHASQPAGARSVAPTVFR